MAKNKEYVDPIDIKKDMYAKLCGYMWERYTYFRDNTSWRDSMIFRRIANEITEKFPERWYYKEVNVRCFVLKRRKGTPYEKRKKVEKTI